MRIGFDAKRLFENKTGLGTYSRNLVNALIEEYPENEYYLYTPDKPSEKHIRNYLDTSNVKIRHPEKINKNYWRTRGILKDLAKDEIEIYHGLSNELPFGIHNTTIKTVVTIHDLLFKQFPQDYTLVDRMIYDWKSKYACSNADRVIAISLATKKSIRAYYNTPESQISTIYQEIDPIFRKKLTKEDQTKRLKDLRISEDFILFVGNDSKRKNLVTVLKALSLLDKNLVMVLNRGTLNKECSDLIRSLGIKDQIRILTDVSKNQLQALYTKSKCLAYPSLGEGWGLPVEEAIACNTYAIVPNYPPFNEHHSNKKFLLNNPNNAKELAERIESIWDINDSEPQLKDEFDKNSLKYYQLYSDICS